MGQRFKCQPFCVSALTDFTFTPMSEVNQHIFTSARRMASVSIGSIQ